MLQWRASLRMMSQTMPRGAAMKRLALCLLFFTLVLGCKKSVEGESKTWDRANQTVEELKILSPGFKAALAEQQTAAKTAMEAAKAVEGKKDKIKKMSAANHMLTGGFVDQLSNVDAAKKKIRSTVVELAGKANDERDRAGMQKATEQADQVLAEVEAILKRGAKTPTEASVVLKKVTSDLESAEKNLAMVAKSAGDKESAKAAKIAADEAEVKAAAAAAAKAKEPPPPWKCEYCSKDNPAERTTCKHCGADHK
jgi:hypothetical protein